MNYSWPPTTYTSYEAGKRMHIHRTAFIPPGRTRTIPVAWGNYLTTNVCLGPGGVAGWREILEKERCYLSLRIADTPRRAVVGRYGKLRGVQTTRQSWTSRRDVSRWACPPCGCASCSPADTGQPARRSFNGHCLVQTGRALPAAPMMVMLWPMSLGDAIPWADLGDIIP